VADRNFYNTKIDDMDDANKGIAIAHINEVAGNHIDIANQLYTEANTTERSLGGQLILLNTVVLTASLVALGNEKIFSQLLEIHKVLIFSVLLLQVFSILSGIKSYREVEKFYIASGDTSREGARIAQSRNKEFNTIGEMEDKVKANDSSAPKLSSKKWVDRQIKSLVASLLLFLIVVAVILFR
jgi:hypothetical protein